MRTLSQISSNPSDVIDVSLNSTALSDEFIEHFDSLMLQISWTVTMLSNLLISNVLFSFLILFDRLGGDWAKRLFHLPKRFYLSTSTHYGAEISVH